MSLQLQNYMEIVVAERLNGILQTQNMCGCAQCRMDIMAIALNNLTPHYVVTEMGGLFAKANSFNIQAEADVTAKITAAVQMVKAKPRH